MSHHPRIRYGWMTVDLGVNPPGKRLADQPTTLGTGTVGMQSSKFVRTARAGDVGNECATGKWFRAIDAMEERI